jgi:hypothetical protein
MSKISRIDHFRNILFGRFVDYPIIGVDVVKRGKFNV